MSPSNLFSLRCVTHRRTPKKMHCRSGRRMPLVAHHTEENALPPRPPTRNPYRILSMAPTSSRKQSKQAVASSLYFGAEGVRCVPCPNERRPLLARHVFRTAPDFCVDAVGLWPARGSNCWRSTHYGAAHCRRFAPVSGPLQSGAARCSSGSATEGAQPACVRPPNRSLEVP